MFAEAYAAALRAYRFAGGAWYHDADIFSGRPTHYQFNSLQAFWPGAVHMHPREHSALPPHVGWHAMSLHVMTPRTTSSCLMGVSGLVECQVHTQVHARVCPHALRVSLSAFWRLQACWCRQGRGT